MELQTRDTKDIENFIDQLPFYGEEVFMEKHRPNREKYAIGKGREALIKISIGNFIKHIEKKIKPEMMKKYNKEDNLQDNNKNENEMNRGFTSDISAAFENLFKSKSLDYIKIISFLFFLIFLFIIIIEFVFNILNDQKLKKNIVEVKNAYKLIEINTLIKYITTEIVLTNKYKEDYIMIKTYNLQIKEYINLFRSELERYTREFRTIYEDFKNSPPEDHSEKYLNYVYGNTMVFIFTLVNGIPIMPRVPYMSVMSRFANSVYYISTVMDMSKEINLNEKNTYELMYNLLNAYYLCGRELTFIMIEESFDSSKTTLIGKLAFYLSFVFVIIFLIIIWNILSNFLMERQKPINLFLTIKKQIFEDLKNASETFSNKLLNKQMGNEDNEEENQKEYQKNIKEKDINIVKFKAPNEYKTKGKNDKKQIIDFIVLVIFFVLIETYITFKFLYVDNYVENVRKFLNVFNLTFFSYVNTILYIDMTKSFLFDRTIPIFNYRNSPYGIDKASPFYNLFYTLTETFDPMIISTSNISSFLSKTYKEQFKKYFYEDFINLLDTDLSHVPNPNLLILMNKGFKPVILNVYEKLRYIWINSYKNGENILNDKRFCDIDFLLLFVIRPWYNKIIGILNEECNNYLDGRKIVQISLFIVVLVFLIFSYFIVWKSYEQSLLLMLQKSFDLIKLIPEEIKYIIVTKLND